MLCERIIGGNLISARECGVKYALLRSLRGLDAQFEPCCLANERLLVESACALGGFEEGAGAIKCHQ